MTGLEVLCLVNTNVAAGLAPALYTNFLTEVHTYEIYMNVKYKDRGRSNKKLKKEKPLGFQHTGIGVPVFSQILWRALSPFKNTKWLARAMKKIASLLLAPLERCNRQIIKIQIGGIIK